MSIKTESRKESDLYFDSLTATIGERRKGTLSRLKDACDALVARGAPLTLKEIEREVEKLHGKGAGPKAQSLANKTGADLRRYVELREAERAEALPGMSKVPKDIVGLLRSGKADQALTAKVLSITSELKRTRDELKRAKALLAAGLPGFDPTASLISAATAGSGSFLTPSGEPPACIRELAEILADPRKLAAVGLLREASGRIRRNGGTEDSLLSPRLVAEIDRLAGRASRQVLTSEL